MTFMWQRFDIEAPSANPDNLYDHIAASDGHYVLAEDAINREAVNADKIRTLEVQLKEMTSRYHESVKMFGLTKSREIELEKLAETLMKVQIAK